MSDPLWDSVDFLLNFEAEDLTDARGNWTFINPSTAQSFPSGQFSIGGFCARGTGGDRWIHENSRSTSAFKYLHDGTTSYTLDCWIKGAGDQADTVGTLLSTCRTTAQVGVRLIWDKTGQQVSYQVFKGSSGNPSFNLPSGSNTVVNDTEAFVRVTYEEPTDTLTIYVDGVQAAQQVGATNPQSTANSFDGLSLGYSEDGVNDIFRGWYDEVRLTKGELRDGSEVPTAPFPTTGPDPFYDNVTWLPSQDETPGTTTVTDNSPLANTVSVLGNTNYQDNGKFKSALNFDGSGDFVRHTLVQDLLDGKTTFVDPITIDAWIYINAIGSGVSIAGSRHTNASYNTGLQYWVQTDGAIRLIGWDGPGLTLPVACNSAAGVISAGQMYFTRATRDASGLWSIAVDGVTVATFQETGTIVSSNNFEFHWGVNFSQTSLNPTYLYMNGTIEPRFTFGVARPLNEVPTGPYPTEGTAPPATGPTIDTQPQDQTVNEGADATYTIAATTSGGPLSYQWKFNGGNVGTDSTTYIRTNAQVGDDGGIVTCEVTDDNGTTVSNNAAFNVTDVVLTITTQPQTIPLLDYNGTAVYAIAATGFDPLTYQWRDNGVDIPGETGTTYSRANVTEPFSGITCFVSAADGETVESNSVGVTAVSPPTTDLTYTVVLDSYREPIYKRGEVHLSRPLKDGERIEIFRKTPIIQTYFAEALKPFDADAFEFQMDRICMIEQEIEGHACDCREDYTVEPPTNCLPPPCLPYACDSMLNALDGHTVWPLTDATFTPDTPADGVLLKIGTGEDLIIDAGFWGDTDGFFTPGTYPYKAFPVWDGIKTCDPEPQYAMTFDRPNTGAWVAETEFFNTDNVQFTVIAKADDSANEYQFGVLRQFNYTWSPSGDPAFINMDSTINVNTTTAKELNTVTPLDRTFDISSLGIQDQEAVLLVYESNIVLGRIEQALAGPPPVYRQFFDFTYTLYVVNRAGDYLKFGPYTEEFVTSNMTIDGMTPSTTRGGLQISSENQTLIYMSKGTPIPIDTLRYGFAQQLTDYTVPDWCATDPCNPPECEQYACDAIDQELIRQGVEHFMMTDPNVTDVYNSGTSLINGLSGGALTLRPTTDGLYSDGSVGNPFRRVDISTLDNPIGQCPSVTYGIVSDTDGNINYLSTYANGTLEPGIADVFGSTPCNYEVEVMFVTMGSNGGGIGHDMLVLAPSLRGQALKNGSQAAQIDASSDYMKLLPTNEIQFYRSPVQPTETVPLPAGHDPNQPHCWYFKITGTAEGTPQGGGDYTVEQRRQYQCFLDGEEIGIPGGLTTYNLSGDPGDTWALAWEFNSGRQWLMPINLDALTVVYGLAMGGANLPTLDYQRYYTAFRRNFVEFNEPDWCADIPDPGDDSRPTPECYPYNCAWLNNTILELCDSYWPINDGVAPTGTLIDEIGSRTWTVTDTYTAEATGIYGADDCEGKGRAIAGSGAGGIRFDQDLRDNLERYFGFVLNDVSANKFELLRVETMLDGVLIEEYIQLERVTQVDGTIGWVKHTRNWDQTSYIDRTSQVGTLSQQFPDCLTEPGLITMVPFWRYDATANLNRVQWHVYMNEHRIWNAVVAAPPEQDQTVTYHSGLVIMPGIASASAKFSQIFLTKPGQGGGDWNDPRDNPDVVELRLAHKQNQSKYNNGEAPTYCEGSPQDPGGELCVSPCYEEI